MAAGKLVAGDFADHLFARGDAGEGLPSPVLMPDSPVTKQAVAAARASVLRKLLYGPSALRTAAA